MDYWLTSWGTLDRPHWVDEVTTWVTSFIWGVNPRGWSSKYLRDCLFRHTLNGTNCTPRIHDYFHTTIYHTQIDKPHNGKHTPTYPNIPDTLTNIPHHTLGYHAWWTPWYTHHNLTYPIIPRSFKINTYTMVINNHFPTWCYKILLLPNTIITQIQLLQTFGSKRIYNISYI